MLEAYFIIKPSRKRKSNRDEREQQLASAKGTCKYKHDHDIRKHSCPYNVSETGRQNLFKFHLQNSKDIKNRHPASDCPAKFLFVIVFFFFVWHRIVSGDHTAPASRNQNTGKDRDDDRRNPSRGFLSFFQFRGNTNREEEPVNSSASPDDTYFSASRSRACPTPADNRRHRRAASPGPAPCGYRRLRPSLR